MWDLTFVCDYAYVYTILSKEGTTYVSCGWYKTHQRGSSSSNFSVLPDNLLHTVLDSVSFHLLLYGGQAALAVCFKVTALTVY